MAQVNAGRVRFVSRGEYNNTTQYYLFDLVNYEGSSYVAIGNTLGNLPTNTTYWQLIAEKGNVGSVGPVGPQGVGISNITKTSSEGLVDTYTITYTDGTTSTFNITNGEDGSVTPTEFNALKERVEDLEDNQITLPAEGTNIHVDNAAKARLYEFEFEKESSQKTTTGKNLFNGNAVSTTTPNNWGIVFENDILTITHKTSYTTGSPKLELGLLPAGTYILSGTLDSNFGLNINGSYSKSLNNGDTFTCDGTQSIDLVVPSSGFDSGTSRQYKNVQLELGTQATPYEEYTDGQPSPNPDYPQDVKVVEGYRNLFDFVNGNYVSGNGATINRIDGEYTIINVSSEYGGARFLQSDLQLKPKTNYTFSAMIKDTNSEIGSYVFIPKAMNLYNREILGNIITSNGISIVKFTTPKEIPSTAFIGLYPRGLNVSATFTNIMIIEGDQELPYVPYGNNYIAVNVSDGTNTNSVLLPLNGNEIAGIGNYLDEYIVDKSGHCWLEKKFPKKIFNGNEEWNVGNGGGYTRFFTSIDNSLETTGRHEILSNYFRYSFSTNEPGIGFIVSGNIYFYPTDASITIVNQFKSWLNEHNTVAYYQAQIPQLIDLNTTVDLKLFKGVNNITNSEDGNMRIRYVESIESIINDFDTRLKALEQGESL